MDTFSSLSLMTTLQLIALVSSGTDLLDREVEDEEHSSSHCCHWSASGHFGSLSSDDLLGSNSAPEFVLRHEKKEFTFVDQRVNSIPFSVQWRLLYDMIMISICNSRKTFTPIRS